MPLDDASAKARLEMICGAETVNHGPGALDELLKVSDGDLRKGTVVRVPANAQLMRQQSCTCKMPSASLA